MHNRTSLTQVLLVWIGVLGLLPGLAPAEDELLQPDQAFRIAGQAEGPRAVNVEWTIADGYYMYRDKLKFQSETPGIEVGTPSLPEALIREDEFFGKVPIYRDRLRLQLPLEREPGAAETLTLQVRSQGCADLGICYPPHTQTILVELPGAAAEEAAPAASATPAPAKDDALQALADLGSDLGLNQEDELLDPEDAYRFEVAVEDGNHLRLNWQIAEGTYLYKEKIELGLEGGVGVALGPYELPEAEVKKDSIRPDGSFGDIEVYHNAIDFPVALVRSQPGATETTLVAKFQGCAEIGVCYPPMTKRVNLALPAAAEVSAEPPPMQPAPAAAQPISEQDQIAATLAGGNTWLIIASFFGFGLLLAFTPCVFPMIPILSGIIAGQGRHMDTRKAFVLSLVYVLAMALTYTAAGVLAGMFGQNLQAAFQNPWILGTFAGVFVLLSLSMFGFYELQVPSRLQSRLTELSNRQEGGTLIGVAIMGFLSALIVGPCVAPPLAGALIYIGQTGDAILGGLALFALSMGMGLPLIAIGTSAGKLLPRAGSWMDAIKAVFGVLLLAVAIVLLERIVPAAVAMLLWGGLLIVSAVYMGALRDLPIDASGWSRLWKGLGLVLLIYGGLMLVGAAAGGKDTLQPLRGLGLSGGGEVAHLQFQRIKSSADLDRELAAAADRGQPTMLDFYADWCVTCKEMERYTFSDPAVITALEGVLLLQADVTANDEQDQALLQGRFGLPGPPAIMFFDTNGQEREPYRMVGFKPAQEFAEHVRQALQ
jgi:thiol:disulfide interchange protein DsbD